ncbi:hypothetical protein ABH999_000668 [Bradyrhizobium yuanmingense]
MLRSEELCLSPAQMGRCSAEGTARRFIPCTTSPTRNGRACERVTQVGRRETAAGLARRHARMVLISELRSGAHVITDSLSSHNGPTVRQSMEVAVAMPFTRRSIQLLRASANEELSSAIGRIIDRFTQPNSATNRRTGRNMIVALSSQAALVGASILPVDDRVIRCRAIRRFFEPLSSNDANISYWETRLTLNSFGVSSRPALRIFFDHVGALLRHHYCRCVGVTGGYGRHDRGINDAESGKPMHT